jgi:hypothetical protein
MLNEDFQLQLLIGLMNCYADEWLLVDLYAKMKVDDDLELVVVDADDNFEDSILLVNVMVHNNIHHNTYLVGTIVVVVDVYGDCNERLVNLFALVAVFVSFSDY